VVDSASIEINRRARQAKTDKLDVGKLLGMLIRYHEGERKVWWMVKVPSVEAEDSRQLHREMTVLKGERTRYINRIKGLLIGQGICMSVNTDFLERLKAVRLWDGGELPKGLHTRLEREYQRIEMVNQQIRLLEAERTDRKIDVLSFSKSALICKFRISFCR
jgi:transposase